MINHTIDPIFDDNSRILILGSFPSVKSREVAFFYGHPQNRFWKVLAKIYDENIPLTIDDKKSLLIRNKIALWDVIKSCDITGSADNSIKNVIPNDISSILKVSNIEKIYVNGRKAESLYKEYLEETLGIKAIYLPSTSPANARMNLDTLLQKWIIIKQ